MGVLPDGASVARGHKFVTELIGVYMPLASAEPRQCGGGIKPSQTGRIDLSQPLLVPLHLLPRTVPGSLVQSAKYPTHLLDPFFSIRISILLLCVCACHVHHSTLRVLWRGRHSASSCRLNTAVSCSSSLSQTRPNRGHALTRSIGIQ
jgi:hypothetical protein